MEESGREAQLGCIIELALGTQISLSVSERSGSILFIEKFSDISRRQNGIENAMKWDVWERKGDTDKDDKADSHGQTAV